MPEMIATIKLHSTAGGSDKVYQLWVHKRPDGTYNVLYANGRRGHKEPKPSYSKPKNRTPYSHHASAINLMNALAFQKREQRGYHTWGACSLCLTPGSSIPSTPVYISEPAVKELPPPPAPRAQPKHRVIDFDDDDL